MKLLIRSLLFVGNCLAVLMLPVVSVTAQTIQQTVYLNFTLNGSTAASPWNNLTAPPTQQPTYSGIKDSQGANTPITIQSLTNWSSFFDNTSQGSGGMASGIYPANVVKTYFFADAGSTERLHFSGLNTARHYRFTFFGSRNSGGDRTTTYKVGSQQVSLNASNNTNQTVTLEGLQPSASGELLLELVTPSSSLFGYLNSVIVEAYNPVAVQTPTGLTAQAASQNSVQLTWTDNNSSETGYEVYRSTSNNSGFTKITTTAANATSFTSTGLSAGTTYYFRIRAQQNTTFSAYSATVNATTTSGGGGGPSDAPFTVYLNLTSGQYLAGSPWNNLTAPPTQQPTYSSLKNDQGQTMTLAVKSVTNWSTFFDNTSQGDGGTDSGSYPANVTKTYFFADAGSTEQLRFEGLSTTLAYRFTFFASRSNGGNRTTTYQIGTQSVSLNAANNTNQTVELAGVSPNSSGVLTLKMITPAAAEFGYLNAIVLEGYAPDQLVAPTALSASATSASAIQLAWPDNNTAETGYQIHRATSAAGPFTLIQTTSANATTYTNTSLSAGSTYYYKVRAANGTGVSDFSTVATAVTTSGGGGPPTGDGFTVHLNFTTSEFIAASPWNNLTTPPTQQPTYSGLKNDQGQATPITLQSLSNWSAFFDNTSQGSGGMASGVYPANVIKTYFFADAGSTEQLRLAGLPADYAYRFTFLGSRDGGGNRTTIYKIGSQSVSLNAAGNTNNTVTLSGVYPNTNGELLLELVTPSTSSFGYLNAIILEAYDPNQLAAPTGLVATAPSGSQVVLGWQDTNGSETGYEVERKSGNGAYQIIHTAAANATTYTDNGVSEGTPYFYRVRAINAGGSSAYSAPASVTPGTGGGGPVMTMYLNFTLAGAEAAAPWNNLSTPPGQKPTYSGLTDEQGQASAITVQSLTNWSAFADGTSIGTAGMTSGLYPANVMKNFFFTDQGSNEQLRFRGLNPALRYRFTLMGSRNGGGDRTTVYKIGSQQASLNAAYNTTNTVTLDALTPSDNGELLLEIIAPASSLFGYLNAVVLQAYDPNAPVGGGESPVIAALTDTVLTVGLAYEQIIRATAGGSPSASGERVVVLGSSTAAGTGATGGQSWVALLQTHLQSQSSTSQMTNLAVGGYTTRSVMPSGDANHNITKALSLNPSVILVNLPSNDVAAGISDQESMDNFTELKTRADAAGVPIYFTTTQPRNFGTLAERQRLSTQATQIKQQLAPFVVDVYDDLTDADYRIKGQYSSGDGIHLNNAGHQVIFTEVRSLFNTPPAPSPGAGGGGEGITLSVSGLPTFLTFTPEGAGTGTLAGTPTTADLGAYDNIVITATNGAGSSQRTARLTVTADDYVAPTAPTVSNPPDATTAPSVAGTLTPASQSNSNVNYVRSFTPRNQYNTPGQVTTSQSVSNVSVSTEYLDGLGRPVQSVVRGGSGSAAQDLVLPVVYDAQGRQEKQYLPYAASSASGAFRTNALRAQYSFYTSGPANVARSDYPYRQMQYEASPLSRVTKQAAPGKNWRLGSGHEMETRYLVNTGSEVRKWTVTNLTGTTLSAAGTYGAGVLYKTVVTDENEHTTTEFRDKLNQVVLKRVQGPGGNLDTYYVYDDYRLLRSVIPPEASKQLQSNASLGSNASFRQQYLFVYEYDNRQRMIRKQVPGGGTTQMRYDQWDRPVLTQSALQASRGEWSFTKYDHLNRPIITGVSTNATLGGGRFESRTSGGIGYSLTGSSPTVSEANVRTVTYYDGYSFPHAGGSYAFTDNIAARSFRSTARGLVTGTMVRRLDNNAWLKSVTYYDAQYRPMQSIADNHLGGKDRTTTQYRNAVNSEVLTAKHVHNNGSSSRTITQNYQYDHTGRLRQVTHQLDNQAAVTLSAQQYNALGELVQKQVGNNQQTVDYRYNIRGWLTRINDLNQGTRYFNQELYYDFGFTKKQYNGNIAGVKWNRAGGKAHAYGYLYDEVNRVTGADYRAKPTAGNWATQPGNFSVDKVAYDANGNIKALKRYGEQNERLYLWDHLEYTYTGNRLRSVGELPEGQVGVGFIDGVPGSASPEYDYDASGNMTSDDNKGITNVTYDAVLNLPTEVAIAGKGTIEYTYDGAGTKLRQRVVPTDGSPVKATDYVAGFHYTNGTLDFIQHNEGRLMVKGGLAYHYDLKDHLGNTRVTFSNVPVTTTAQASMEAGAAPVEEVVFEGIEESRQTLAFHNTTEVSSEEPQPNKVATVLPGKQGPSKSLQVHAGDTVHLLVNARYETAPSKVQGLEGVATEVAGALQKTAAGLESGGAASGLNGLAAGSALANGKEQNVPQAYLNYLLYDENYQLIDQGFQQVSKAAAVGKSNPSATPEELALEVPIAQEGYLYTYLSNEASASSSAVYFDDFTVEQQSYIVQVDDYYPFGASFDQNVGRVLENKYLWSGKERQTDLNLGWDDFGARFYDPVLGRFHTQDRFADKYHPMTPYQYAANNPMLYIDINGDSLDVGSIMSNSMLGKAFELFAQSEDGQQFLSQFASEGQTLYGHTFEKDGAFHSEGINLSINATESADDLKIPGGTKNGETDFQQTESGLNIEININSYLNADGLYSSDAAKDLRSTSNAYSQGNATAEELRAAARGFWFDRLSTLAHESYQHADRFASSYTLGGSTLLNSRTKREWGILHHSLEGRNQVTSFQNKSFRILQSANLQLKLGYSKSRILNTMY